MTEELTIDKVTESGESVGNQPQTEPVETPDNQAAVSTETSQGDSQKGTTQPGGVSEYTPEELNKIALEQVDIARVPQDRRDFYESRQREKKELLADYTRKSQRLADLERNQSQNQPPSKDPVERINKAYQAGNEMEIGKVFGEYKQAMNNVQEALFNAKAEDPFSTKVVELEKTLFRLNKETQFLQGHTYNLQQQTQFADGIQRDSRLEILKGVPNFEKRDPELARFSATELGLDGESIHLMTDAVAWTQVYASRGYPDAVELGKTMPAKIIKAINKVYDRYNAGKGIETKIKDPTPLARGGPTGSGKKKEIKDFTDNDIESEISRIKFGGQ